MRHHSGQAALRECASSQQFNAPCFVNRSMIMKKKRKANWITGHILNAEHD
ncbi:MAG: hypothetical protein LBU65_16550 [Planctomycetaceae bacterium]|nr:hypothetical protein [Planctomycetaceae bacterium]